MEKKVWIQLILTAAFHVPGLRARLARPATRTPLAAKQDCPGSRLFPALEEYQNGGKKCAPGLAERKDPK